MLFLFKSITQREKSDHIHFMGSKKHTGIKIK